MESRSIEFSIKFEDAIRGLELANNSIDLVQDGVYYAFIVNAFSAPNKKRDGNNLVVDFSIHNPGSIFDKRILRKYLSIDRPGPQLMYILGEHKEISQIIGRAFQILVSRNPYGGEVTNDIRDIMPIKSAVPEAYNEAADLLIRLFDPVNKGVYRRELSVNYFSRAVGHWIINEGESKPQVKSYHSVTRGWVLTHLLGHNYIKLMSKEGSVTIIPYEGNWNYQWFPNPILYTVGNSNFALIKGLDRDSVKDLCKQHGLPEPLSGSTAIELPWHGFNPDNGRFIGDGVKEDMRSQINYIKGLFL